MDGVNFKIIGCERLGIFKNPIFCKNCYNGTETKECKDIQKDRHYILKLVE